MYDTLPIIEHIPDFEDFFNSDKSFAKSFKFKTKSATVHVKDAETPPMHFPIPIIEDCDIKFSKNKITFKFEYSLDDKLFNMTTRRSISKQLSETNLFKKNPTDIDILQLFRKYFEYVIYTLQTHMESTLFHGWTRNDNCIEYLLYENSDIKYTSFYKAPNTRHWNLTSDFFTTLKENPNLALVFAYGLYSVSYHYFVPYKVLKNILEESDNGIFLFPFSLCLYGKIEKKNELTLKQIASVFLDYLISVNPDNDNFNCYHKPHVSLQHLDSRINDLFTIADIPIIIYASGNKAIIRSTAPVVKQVELLRHSFIFKGFPVYVSQAPISRDSILNIKASGILNLDKETAKETVHYLSKSFIQFLQTLPDSMLEDKLPRYKGYSVSHYIKNIAESETEQFFNKSDNNPYLHEYCSQLLIALKRFACFIAVEHSEYSSITEQIVEKCSAILHDMALDCEKVELLQKTLTAVDTDSLYKTIFSEVLKTQQTKFPESITYNEKEGYYIKYDTFLSICNSVILTENHSSLSAKRLLSWCRTTEPPLILPSYRDTAQTKFRELFFIRKEQKVLIIQADIFKSFTDMG